jgi:lactoylglutathione lyase/methylmalonyl-CoA/ethylmalonyl-CoA epimerase
MHHVGIIFPTRERANEFLDIFGFEIEKQEYVEAYHAECIFTRHGIDETSVELIIPTEGVLTNFNNGKGGIHHIALEVEDVEAVRAEYEGKGLKMLEKEAVKGACGLMVNFLRPSFGAGILVEFVEDHDKKA